MSVVGDSIGGTCRHCANHKLIVIRISSDEIKTKSRYNALNIDCVYNGINDLKGERRFFRHMYDYLLILEQSFCANAQGVSPLTESLPNVIPE